jgi:hypothetical protein
MVCSKKARPGNYHMHVLLMGALIIFAAERKYQLLYFLSTRSGASTVVAVQ